MKSDTPETDAYIGEDNEDNMTEGEIAMCEFARRLERQRNDARERSWEYLNESIFWQAAVAAMNESNETKL